MKPASTPPCRLVVVDAGSNNCAVWTREQIKDTPWQAHLWPRGSAGRDYHDTSDQIPTLVALKGRRTDEDHEIVIGHEADTKRRYKGWRVFGRLKHGCLEKSLEKSEIGSQTKSTDRERKIAAELGYSLEELYGFFLKGMLSKVVQEGENCKVYFNSTDCWDDEEAQRLLRVMCDASPSGSAQPHSECVSSTWGALPSTNRVECSVVAIDIGGSTTNICLVSWENGQPLIRSTQTLPYGGDYAKDHAVDELRLRLSGADEREIDGKCSTALGYCETLSLAPDEDLDTPYGLTQEELSDVKQSYEKHVKDLNERRINALREMIKPEGQSYLLVQNGGGVRCKRWQEALAAFVNQAEGLDVARLEQERSSAVVRGLQRIVDEPSLAQPTHCPMDIWLRSDDDTPFEADDEKETQVALICKRGEPLDPELHPGERHPGWPLAFELKVEASGSLEFDATVYTTPPGAKRKDITQGRNEDGFDCARETEVQRLGANTTRLAADAEPGKSYHVYVFTIQRSDDITLSVVYADDFRRLSLTRTKYADVFTEHQEIATFKGTTLRKKDVFQIARASLAQPSATDSPKPSNKRIRTGPERRHRKVLRIGGGIKKKGGTKSRSKPIFPNL